MALRILVVLAALAQIPAAAWLSIGTFEQTTRAYPTFIQPASWAFAIWGLLFVLSLAFAVYQSIPRYDNQTLRAVRVPTLIAFLGSTSWLYVASSTDWTVWLTIPVLGVMAIALHIVVAQPPLSATRPQFFSQFALFPYAAWVGIAQWLNLQVVLTEEGLITSGALNTASNVLLLVCIASYSLYWLRRTHYSLWYGGVIIWAAIGIIATNTSGPEGSVIITAMAGALGLAAMALIRQNAGHPYEHSV